MPSGIKQAFASKLTDVDSVAREALGTLRFEGNKVYKYVELRNVTATVAGVAGNGVAYGAAGGYNLNKVVLDLTDADATKALAAGSLMATVAGVLATSYFLWIQIKGACTLAIAVTAGVIGQGFNLTTVDKTFAVNAAATDQKAGYSISATTAVVLDCPF